MLSQVPQYAVFDTETGKQVKAYETHRGAQNAASRLNNKVSGSQGRPNPNTSRRYIVATSEEFQRFEVENTSIQEVFHSWTLDRLEGILVDGQPGYLRTFQPTDRRTIEALAAQGHDQYGRTIRGLLLDFKTEYQGQEIHRFVEVNPKAFVNQRIDYL